MIAHANTAMQTQRFSDRSSQSQSRFGRGAVSQRSLLRAGADAGVLHPAAADPEEENGGSQIGFNPGAARKTDSIAA